MKKISVWFSVLLTLLGGLIVLFSAYSTEGRFPLTLLVLTAAVIFAGLFFLFIANKRHERFMRALALDTSLSRYLTDISTEDLPEYAECELVGRQRELRIAEIIMERPQTSHLFIVGKRGSGKKTFLYSLARRLRQDSSGVRIFILHINLALTEAIGTQMEKEHFLKGIIARIPDLGKTHLIIDEVGDFLRSKKAYELSKILFLHNSRPKLTFLIPLCPEEYETLLPLEGFGKEYETLFLPNPQNEDSHEIVRKHFLPLEASRLSFSDGALKQVCFYAEKNRGQSFHTRAIEIGEEILLAIMAREAIGEDIAIQTVISEKDVDECMEHRTFEIKKAFAHKLSKDVICRYPLFPRVSVNSESI